MAGQLLSVNEYQALFSLIGCQWGGDCRSSFGIPDMRSRSPVGIGQGQGLPNYQLGQYAGVATQTLTYAQLPQHTHTGAISASSVEATLKAFDGNGAAPSPSASNNSLQTVAQNPFAPATEANLYGPGSGNAVALNGLEVDFSGALTIGSAGGSQPFSVQSPVTALRHCMAVDGVYPQRP
jgi:microcystin-dependent protein